MNVHRFRPQRRHALCQTAKNCWLCWLRRRSQPKANGPEKSLQMTPPMETRKNERKLGPRTQETHPATQENCTTTRNRDSTIQAARVDNLSEKKRAFDTHSTHPS